MDVTGSVPGVTQSEAENIQNKSTNKYIQKEHFTAVILDKW